MDLNLDKLIYLDIEFISRKYEELTGANPQEAITKQEGTIAGIKALFMNAGVHTQESRSYSITSRDMLRKIWTDLNESYQVFKEKQFKNYRGTNISWIKGELTIGEWKKRDREEPGYELYELNHNSETTAFLSNKEYFSAGFREIFNASDALKVNVGIPVMCLARIMWHAELSKNYVACPYIMIEINDS